MYFKTAIVSAVALLFAGQAMGAALIASNPGAACNCPKNCSHKDGSSCKYYIGPSGSSPVVSGTCRNQNGRLMKVSSADRLDISTHELEMGNIKHRKIQRDLVSYTTE
ncbi:hypothetical protein F4813DRAFT_399279 [Daldinia decipiens]|uniref:uncharacterized protein n=1 Tax=Daldinia decipiens TaxID=326647 RepID=UPI0020C419E6|nr:uncharacterized protein F4813DRAFT_399279 [Daldinia decipiens]KAI1661256.1 hypothetical protein F4813DRAFT_399279 [Daldinia decipiens]